jgi:hypothetical protein
LTSASKGRFFSLFVRIRATLQSPVNSVKKSSLLSIGMHNYVLQPTA